ncbi:MAG: hypothetical protein II650_03650, partial [Clostridia bacterium]|nr:hypothetical protein [Clostridia bacterium]
LTPLIEGLYFNKIKNPVDCLLSCGRRSNERGFPTPHDMEKQKANAEKTFTKSHFTGIFR